MKIAFITAIVGNYEVRLHESVKQSVPCDFIAFTDGLINSNSWKTYPLTHHPTFLKTDYDIAKWYKLQFYKIDFLKEYDFIVWLDGSLEITNPNLAETIINNNNVCSLFSHEWRNGLLINEAIGMRDNKRYDDEEPLMIMDRFYNNGYKETFFKLYNKNIPSYGVFITCLIAWKNCNLLIDFFDEWWTLHLSLSKNDQLTFSYLCWKYKMFPYDLINIYKGKPHFKTDAYIKHQHGK